MPEGIDQIAAEALSNLYDVVVVSQGRDKFIATGMEPMKAAIEKAFESPDNVAALKAMYNKGVEHGRAAQAGEK